MHELVDNQGPILVLVQTKDNYKFGAFANRSWDQIGGWRKCKKSYLFSVSDGKLRRPFLCPVKSEAKEICYQALFFSEKYGLVFGRNDLSLDFDNMKNSKSKLGMTYSAVEEFGEYGLAGKHTDWDV